MSRMLWRVTSIASLLLAGVAGESKDIEDKLRKLAVVRNPLRETEFSMEIELNSIELGDLFSPLNRGKILAFS